MLGKKITSGRVPILAILDKLFDHRVDGYT